MHALNLLHFPEHELGLVVGCICVVRERTDLVWVHPGHVWISFYELGLELETLLEEIANSKLTAFATGFKFGVFNDEIHCFLDKTGGLFRLLCATYKIDLPKRLLWPCLLLWGLISCSLGGSIGFLNLLLIIVCSLSVHLGVGPSTCRVRSHLN